MVHWRRKNIQGDESDFDPTLNGHEVLCNSRFGTVSCTTAELLVEEILGTFYWTKFHSSRWHLSLFLVFE
jgi:hypothetical protein